MAKPIKNTILSEKTSAFLNKNPKSGKITFNSQTIFFYLNWHWSDRRGRLAVPANIPSNAPPEVKKAKGIFLNVHAARLFNLLSKFSEE